MDVPCPQLEQAIATTWPQQLTKLAALDLPGSKLGPAAATALLYDMPSLTSLQCRELSAPTRQQLVSPLRYIRVVRADLPTLASLRLGPQCNLDLKATFINLCSGEYGPVGVEEGLQQLTAAADTIRHSDFIGLSGWINRGHLEAEASERVVRTLAAGLRGGSHRIDSLMFRSFTFQQGSSAAALVELLQAAPLVDSLSFE